ncbi:MAG: rRNA maturation RNase YbeY [Acidimicrobiia bacterium]|nr:rRNA maturation RNase YbeY [Acidimicrobiia bacterium]
MTVPRRNAQTVEPGTFEVFAADEQHIQIPLPKLVELAREALADVGVAPDVSTNLLFIDSESIQALNLQFRGKDEPTDVLSFPMDEEALPGAERPSPTRPGGSESFPPVLGDLVVCPEIAQMQAQVGGWDFHDELALLTVHGILHLCGYDHEEDSEAEAMEAKEADLLDRLWSGGNARRKRDAADSAESLTGSEDESRDPKSPDSATKSQTATGQRPTPAAARPETDGGATLPDEAASPSSSQPSGDANDDSGTP